MRSSLKLMLLIGFCVLSVLQTKAYDFEVDGLCYTITSPSRLEVELVNPGDTAKTYRGNIVVPTTVNWRNRTYSVVSIGEYAFARTVKNITGYYDKNPLTVVVPDGIKEIKTGAFEGRSQLTKVQLPHSIERISPSSFNNCRGLHAITIPSNVTEIGDSAFWWCSSLSYIELPENLTTIGGHAFHLCKSLTSIKIPDNLTTIEEHAFFNCPSLTNLILPKNLSLVGKSAFGLCPNLSAVFCLADRCPNGFNLEIFKECHPYLEIFVPSVKNYGFGKEYVTINSNKFNYSGHSHLLDVTNNITAYNCSILNTETKKDAGVYKDTLLVTYSDEVDFSVDIPFEYTIAPAPLTAQIDDIAREYGDTNPQFNCKLSGFVNNESLDTEGISLAFECEATQNSPAGEYSIRASIDAKNYDVTYSYGTLTINKAPLSMSIPNVTKVYGMQNPEFKIVYEGLKNNEKVPEWITAPSISTSAAAASPVGEYDVTINGADPRNYNVTAVHNGKLTVTPKDAVVKVKNYTRCYGQQNPAFDCEYIGLISGESSDFLLQEPSISTDATFDSPVGVYKIVAADAVAKNYSFAYESGLLTITKAPQKIEWKQSFDNIKPGTKVELTAQSSSGLPVVFESLKQSVATIETEGEKVYVHFLAPGSVTLQASQTGNENYEPAEAVYVNVTVIQAAESIALSETEITLDEYDTFTLVAEVRPSTTTDKGVAWSSSDETVATVTNGLVRAVNQGSAIITAKTTDGTNLSATCNVRVVKPVIGIIVEPTAIEIEAGETATIVAGAVPSNATNTKLLWASENETVATVTQQGVVTAIAEGDTKISVSATDGSGVQAFCDVKVKPEESGIHDVAVGDDLVTVYATDGTCVMRNAKMSEVYRLHPGVYLVRTNDGTTNKVVVK